MTTEKVLASGVLERVGSDDAQLHCQCSKGVSRDIQVQAPDHTAGMKTILAMLTDDEVGVLESIDEIRGVGHRVVHAGDRYHDSVIINNQVIRTIEDLCVLSPLHNPPNLQGIRASIAAMPDKPQVAVFDTAFLATMPEKAWMYAVPREWYENYRIRKYGFHGTSHRYVTLRAAKLLNKPVDQINLITCHLGNGCSMTAVAGGKAVDHSMGLTPLPGLVMGTRSGDIDPAVVFYLIKQCGMKPDEVDRALNKKAGLLGVSGVSNDMRDLLAAAEQGNERAALAVELFCYRAVRYIGSYYTILPDVDAVVFTGGIGENSTPVRERICRQLSRLGAEFDAEANDATIKGKTGPITAPGSDLPVWIVPTNEELMIARDTRDLVLGRKECVSA